MDCLIKNYGQFTLEDMHDKDQDFIAMYCNPNTSIDTMFSAVNKFRDLCILTKQPKSDYQLMNISNKIFSIWQ